MSAAPGIRVVGGGGGPAADAAPGSVLASLRARAKAQRQDKTLDLAVGGDFGEHLVVRYGLLALDELDRYAILGQSGRTPDMTLAIDMMVAACRTLLWRDNGVDTDLAVGLDAGLWQLLDWPLPPGVEAHDDLTAREVVDALFGHNGSALAQHLDELARWMQNPRVIEPGESSAAT
jgi:hypothetical protein